MVEQERAPTGICGLDELLEGGFPRQRTVLVAGACGTGKTTFGMQFAYNGAVEYKEPGVFVSSDELPERIRTDMARFGWNLGELEKNNLLALIDGTSSRAGTASGEEHALLPDSLDFEKTLLDILGVCRRIGAKRLVIDSVTAMGLHVEDEAQVRRDILKLAFVLARSGLTTILTSEIPEQGIDVTQFSHFNVEEYVVDGLVTLGFYTTPGSPPLRTLSIRKMRGTRHSMERHLMEIADKGIVVRQAIK